MGLTRIFTLKVKAFMVTVTSTLLKSEMTAGRGGVYYVYDWK